MAKFSEVVAGVRARRSIKLPLPGATVDGETGEWLGPTHELEVRVLNEGEYDEVLASALAFSKKKGLGSPEDGDALYERGKMLYTLAAACIDKDSPADAPAPFFDGGVEQIRKSEIMTPEVIGYLYEQQQLMQEEVAPMKGDMSPAEYMAAAIQTAKGNMAFFVNTRLGTRWNFTRFLASQFIASLANSSPSTSPSEPQITTPKSEEPSG